MTLMIKISTDYCLRNVWWPRNHTKWLERFAGANGLATDEHGLTQTCLSAGGLLATNGTNDTNPPVGGQVKYNYSLRTLCSLCDNLYDLW